MSLQSPKNGGPDPEKIREVVSAQLAGRFAEAETVCRQLFDAGAEVRTVCLLASTLAQQRRLYEADRLLAEMRRYGEPTAEYFGIHGNILIGLERFAEALTLFLRGLVLAPRSAALHCSIATAMTRLDRHDDALAWCDRALVLSPDIALAHCCRAVALDHLDRHEDALASADRALAVAPGLHLARFMRGFALQQLDREDEALACYAAVIAGMPDFAEAHHNSAHLFLAHGDFERGWPEYEWRWRISKPSSAERKFSEPLWLGTDDLAGKTILLHSEQGLGDTLQYCRYAAAVARAGGRVILEVQPSLVALMVSLAGPAEIVATGAPLPRFDCHCPLASLPLAFRTCLDTIPAATPYLSADPVHVAKWRQRLPQTGGPLVCLAWAGNANFIGDRRRSVLLPRLLPLVREAQATFVSVQKDLRDGDLDILAETPQIAHWGDELATFADTAAIVSLADLVISSDTAIVHLAGALAKPVWALLPAPADWRWLRGRDDSPWYPTLRLFRQESRGDWAGVVARVAQDLCRLAPLRHA
jgi:tetratricopeptide (TPR) repeat protein